MTDRATLPGVSVLLVEDEAIVAMDLEGGLLDAGAARVRLAMSLAEARAIFADWRPDAAVLDMRLPDGTTEGLARELTRAGVPVVFHTGNSDPASLARAFPEARVVRKPSTSEEVATALGQMVTRLATAAE